MRVVALLLASSLLLAGCSAPVADPTVGPPAGPATGTSGPTATDSGGPTRTPGGPPEPTDTSPTAAAGETPADEPAPATLAASYDIRVEGGSLPVNVSLVFARVALLLDRPNASAPRTVTVRSNERMALGPARYPEFYRLLGIRIPDGEERALTAAAYVTSADAVTVNRAILNDSAETESTLAHESVHVVQFQTDAFRRVSAGLDDRPRSTARRLLARSVVEGSATAVQAAYGERYLPANRDPIAAMGASYRNASGAARLGYAPYYFGGRYVRARTDGPADVRRVYRRPPQTAEELIHRLPPGSEPVANLTVVGAEDDGWTRQGRTRDAFGELFLRVVLGTELNESAAARGADGWGADRRYAFVGPGGNATGYAWVLRFDDAANASEFERTFAAWRDAREPDESTVRAVRAGDRTVAVFLGNESFVSAARASAENDTVTIRVGETA